MADITKCRDKDCPVKEKCYRWTAEEDMMQSYFVESPRSDEGCEMFWGENSEQIMNQLKDIVNGAE